MTTPVLEYRRPANERLWSWMAIAALPVGAISCPLLLPHIIEDYLHIYTIENALLVDGMSHGWALAGMIFCFCAWLRVWMYRDRLRGVWLAATGFVVAALWLVFGLVLQSVFTFR